jgi:hypothetical protein
VHPALLAMAIPAISPSEITLKQFQAKSGIVSKATARDVLEYIVNNGIGVISSQDHYFFSKADRMKLAILALQSGYDIEKISKSISWKDFEALTSEILNLSSYITETNIHFSKPCRMEIDVVGVNSKLAIVADCKHWKRNNLSSLSSYARKQVKRTKILFQRIRRKKRRGKGISYAVPILLTLYSTDIQFIDGVPIVPISKFKSFIEDVPLYLQEIQVISTNT